MSMMKTRQVAKPTKRGGVLCKERFFSRLSLVKNTRMKGKDGMDDWTKEGCLVPLVASGGFPACACLRGRGERQTTEQSV